jgi:protein tyrosine/serine phosphatase
LLAACAPPLIDPATLPDAGPDGAALAKPRSDVHGLPNFARVSDALWRCGQPSADGLRWAQQNGLKTVVNLRGLHSDDDELEGLDLRYFEISTSYGEPDADEVAQFLKIVSDPANQPVLVHCWHGSDRTGLMVGAYRRVIDGWSAADTLAELPNFGFNGYDSIADYLRDLDPDDLRRRMVRVALPQPVPID